MTITNRHFVLFANIDKALDQLSPLESFMSKEEYLQVYAISKDNFNRERLLKTFLSKTTDCRRNEIATEIPLELYANTDNTSLLEVAAVVPIEYQIVRRNKLSDILVCRIYLGAKKYRISIIKITDEIQKKVLKGYDKSDIEIAYFKYIHKNIKKLIRQDNSILCDWLEFRKNFSSKGYPILEFSQTGVYLWHSDFQLFDNRAIKDGKPLPLVDQLHTQEELEIENVETLMPIILEEKKVPVEDSNLFKDEYGNYWKNEKSYINYKKFLTAIKNNIIPKG